MIFGSKQLYVLYTEYLDHNDDFVAYGNIAIGDKESLINLGLSHLGYHGELEVAHGTKDKDLIIRTVNERYTVAYIVPLELNEWFQGFTLA